MIHVTDPRLVRLIALGKKTTHRFPAHYKSGTNRVTNPKIRPGIVHRVYLEPPFGRDGNPDAQPMILIDVESVTLDVLCDTTDEDARTEGFASLEAFVRYWDEKWEKKALRYASSLYNPVWVVKFKLREVLPAGKKIIAKIEKQRKNKESRRDNPDQD
jgi:hypothetical protein